MPVFQTGNALRLDSGRNPVLEAKLRALGRKAVPLSLALGGDETVMVISGPNTGGKTVALKIGGAGRAFGAVRNSGGCGARGDADFRSRAGGYRG